MITTIDKLFKVEYGQKEYENKSLLEGAEGKNIVVSSRGEDNGVYGFFNTKNGYKAPVISVPRTGTIGQAFVQLINCSIDNNCLVLIPKGKLGVEDLFQVAFQIRLTKWKYKYGRQITPDRLKQEKIKLVKSNINYKEFSEKITPRQIKKEIIGKTKTKLVRISELCNIDKKTALPQNAISLDGNIPYVSSSSKDNGVVFFTDEEPNFKAKSLTVAKDGNDGYSFYQPFNFITSLHNYVLTPKNNYPSSLLIYVGAIIRIKAYCYNHYYPINKRHIENMEIPMPINGSGKYDFAHIEKLIKNSYGFKQIKEYL